MYSRVGKLRKKNLIITALGVLSALIIVVGVLLNQQQIKSTGFTTKAKAEVIEKTVAKSTSQSSTSEEKLNQEIAVETESSEVPVVAEPEVAQVQEVAAQPVTTDAATVTATSYSASSVALANGNTAGEVGTSAAAQMAAATGVSQTVWEQIIARESNGNPYVSNGSGASGLFQTMPGWGSTATVQDQINSAINAYNAQGLSAWGY